MEIQKTSAPVDATVHLPRSMWQYISRHAVILAMGLALAIIAGYVWHLTKRVEPHFVTIAVGRGTVEPAIISSGAVNPVTTIQVGTYVSGVIQSILCDFNTQVKAGQLCAKIDPRPYQTAVDQESAALEIVRAQLTKDRANLDYARLINQRNANLLQRGIVSQEVADTSVNAYNQAKAQIGLDEATIRQHEAQLKAARINLGYTDIVSPVDGTVVSRNVTQGQTVAASFQTPTLFLIATDLTTMQVDTNVSESDIGGIAVGNSAIFTVSSFPERQFRGTVQQVRQAPQTVQNVVTYDVVVSAPNLDLALKPGMTTSVRIVTNRADNALRVPEQALRYRPTTFVPEQDGSSSLRNGAGQVWILASGKPTPVLISIGLNDDTYAQIIAGDLHEGDQVIMSERAEASGRSSEVPSGLVPPRR